VLGEYPFGVALVATKEIQAMSGRLAVFLTIIGIACLAPSRSAADDGRLERLEKRVQQLEQRGKQAIGPEVYALPGFTLFSLALFCALWARSTGRDPWLWLAAGLVFNVFALLAVWSKHEADKKMAKTADPGGPFERPREDGALSENVRPA
jgi:hypothetical protein